MKTKFIILIIICLNLTGCYNYKEIKDSSVVTAISIDASETGKYRVGAEFIKAGDSGQELESEVLITDCDTIYEGLHHLIKLVNKNVYLGYCELIVLGSDLAENGISEVLNYFIRNAEYRSDMLVFIAKDTTGEELIKGKNIEQKILGHGVSDSARAEENFLSTTIYSKLYKIIDEIETENCSALISSINTVKVNDEDIVTMSGCGFFNGDRLIGYLSEDETLTANIINNNVKQGNFAVENGNIILGVKLSDVKSKLKVKNGNIIVDMDLSVIISEVNKDSLDSSKIEKIVSSYMKERVEKLIIKMKNDKKADIFGIYTATNTTGEVFRDYYRGLNPDVTVKVTVKGSGIIENSN